MTGFESFVGVNPWTALFTFCNMLITFAVLKKFLFKPVKKMIDDRQQEIDTMYADADAAKQKAADLEKEYADHLQSIKDERDTMLREATARAQKREEEIVNEAKVGHLRSGLLPLLPDIHCLHRRIFSAWPSRLSCSEDAAG